MTGLIQRVFEAVVCVGGRVVGEVDPGLLALVCAKHRDTAIEADHLLEKLLDYRVFFDAQGKMNLPVHNIGDNGQMGGLLVVSQSTLTADTKSGTRSSSTPAAAPESRRRLYERFMMHMRVQHPIVATDELDASVRVPFANDGSVTF